MCRSRQLVTSFLRCRLQQRGHSWSRLCEQDGAALPGGVAAHPEDGPEAERTCRALREAAEEFELRYRRAFSDLSAQLRVTPDTVYRRFEQVVGELFRDGVNWGRLVAFFCFGAALCVESAEKELGALVPRIAHWMSTYLENNLEPWIQQQGGWDAFVVLYGNNAAARNRELQEVTMKWFMALMAVGATLALAVYLARRR